MRRVVLLLATVAGMVLLVVATGLMPDQRLAGAQTEEDGLAGPTLQFGCDIVKVAAIDPIVDPEHPHEHVFYGNKGVDADSTYESLVNNKDTTCSLPFATSSYWNPVVKDGTTEVNMPRKLSIYYTGKGDQAKVQPIPDGLQLIGNKDNGKVDYRCGEEPPVTSPPYGCTADEYRIRVHFPECWNRSSLKPDSLVRMSGGSCPSSHPYQIPTIRFSVHYENVGGVLEGPLQVSAGDGQFLGADFFHADVFAAPQEPDFRDTIEKCVNNVADGAAPPTVCRPGLRPDTTLAPSGPSGTVESGSGIFTFSSPEPDATFECRVYEAGTTPAPDSFGACSGNGTHEVSGLSNGTYTLEVRAVEPFSGQGDLTPASRTWTVDVTTDTTAPMVGTTTPTGGETEVGRNANVTATFSEEMASNTLTKDTVQLKQKQWYQVRKKKGKKVRKVWTYRWVPVNDVQVSCDNTDSDNTDSCKRATLDPDNVLVANTDYVATITTGVKDVGGNALAQNYSWTFKTGSS